MYFSVVSNSLTKSLSFISDVVGTGVCGLLIFDFADSFWRLLIGCSRTAAGLAAGALIFFDSDHDACVRRGRVLALTFDPGTAAP